jgi:hypothetical protein
MRPQGVLRSVAVVSGLSADASQQGFTKLVPLPPRCPRGHRRSRWNCPRAELPAGTRGTSVRALFVAQLRSGHPGRCRLSRGRAGTHGSRRGWLPPPAGCGSRACRARCRRRAPVARSARGSPRTPKRSATVRPNRRGRGHDSAHSPSHAAPPSRERGRSRIARFEDGPPGKTSFAGVRSRAHRPDLFQLGRALCRGTERGSEFPPA